MITRNTGEKIFITCLKSHLVFWCSGLITISESVFSDCDWSRPCDVYLQLLSLPLGLSHDNVPYKGNHVISDCE